MKKIFQLKARDAEYSDKNIEASLQPASQNSATPEAVRQKPAKSEVHIGRIIARIALYAILIIFAAMVIIPLLWVVMSSLKTKEDIANNNPWSLPTVLYFKNYVNAFVEAHMGDYFLNTVFITVLSMFFLVILTVPCAYVLSRFKFKGVKILSLLMLAGIFINANFIVVPLFNMVNSFGVAIGVYGLADNIFVVSIIYAATSLAFSVYLMSGFFVSLSPAYEEAAKIDGCGYFRTLIYIIVPLSLPSIIIILLFSFLRFWNEYLIAITFLVDKAHWTLSIGLLDLMEVEKLAGDKGRMFAGLVIVMLPVLILFVCLQKYLTQGVTMGGVKG